MNIISKKEDNLYGNETVVYELDVAILSDNIQMIIKSFENEHNKMSSCHISTFSDSGSCSDCTFYNINELERLKDFPSPYMTFYIDYVDRQTNSYSFSIKTSSNDNRIFVFADKKKIEQENKNGRGIKK